MTEVHNRGTKDETAVPPPAPPELGFEDFQRIYGPIQALSPTEAASLFDGAPFRWWVAGGWSVELESSRDASTRISRSPCRGAMS